MEIDDGLGAFSGLQESHVLFIILEEILGEDGRAAGVAEDVEVALDIRITIRVVFTEPVAGEPVFGGPVEGCCEPVCRGLSRGGVAALSAGVNPFSAGSCSVDVKGDEEYLVFAQFLTECVDPAAALREGDIIQLRNQEPGIEAQGDQVFLNLFCEEASVCVFAEEAVRAPLARGVLAVAIVEEDCHFYRLVCDGKLGIKCGNNYIQDFPLSLQIEKPHNGNL